VAIHQGRGLAVEKKTVIRATDLDASEYDVTDGHGRRITNCFEADSFEGTVTVAVIGSDGRWAISDSDEVVKATYRPRGGVRIVRREPI
jgi:hypothetical protein